MFKTPRLTSWLIVSIVLFIGAWFASHLAPANLLSVTIYKAHLLSLAGWAGYWLDRVLFPYARPHVALQHAEEEMQETMPMDSQFDKADLDITPAFVLAEWSMMRRAVIVAACIIGACLGG